MINASFESEFQSPGSHAADRHRLVVRARIQDMRIAAIWQVLLPFSSNVENVDITTSQDSGFEEVAIALVRTRRDLLDSIVARFNNMSWVMSTKLC